MALASARILLLLVLFLFLGKFSTYGSGFEVEPVLFGERDRVKYAHALFFDRDGNLYPDWFIADTSLAKHQGRLWAWYQTHPVLFLEISRFYKCRAAAFSPAGLDELNDSIASRFRQQLHKRLGEYQSVTFLLHGFRKPFAPRNRDSTSPLDFQWLQDSLSHYATERTFFLPVFWDGLYGCCFTFTKEFRKGMARLYAEAQEHAAHVGAGFRRAITGISCPKLNILTFSLGALVAAHALFNVKETSGATPLNATVNICLMAPAIGGVEMFRNYKNRNADQNPGAADNYRLCIAWNKNDFVLKKKDPKTGLVGPGPYKYGVTTLGCNHHNEVGKLETFFAREFPQSYITDADLSETGKCHLIRCYARGANMKKLLRFLESENPRPLCGSRANFDNPSQNCVKQGAEADFTFDLPLKKFLTPAYGNQSLQETYRIVQRPGQCPGCL